MTLTVGTGPLEWAYDTPLPEAARVAGHVAFEGDGIEVDLSDPAA